MTRAPAEQGGRGFVVSGRCHPAGAVCDVHSRMARPYDLGVDIPDDLIALERVAEEERANLAGLVGPEWEAQRRVWREAAERVQAAVTAWASETGEDRVAVEMAVKRAVRHQDEDPAE